MSELEQAAVEFIHARDAKARAKADRNNCKCREESACDEEGRGGYPPCWQNPDHGLCEACDERNRLHQIVVKLTPRATRALNRLRRIVHARDKAIQ